METFRILENADVVIIDISGSAVILDTGSPISFGRGTVSLLGRNFTLSPATIGVDIDQIQGLLGFPVKALLGNDVLGHFDICVRWKDREVDITDQRLSCGSIVSSLRSPFKLPLLDFELADRLVLGYLDTGASFHYADPELVRGRTAIGQKSDFHPNVGAFETPLYRLPMSVQGQRWEDDFGILPPTLQAQMQVVSLLFGSAWNILGVPLLERFDLTLHYRDGRMSLQPR